mmetsp:Transcript_22999/g.44178  ORF Transcript_22999/g.44178 Transcript_22999/m.44178 type:complete len:1120 (-) Transcript_22999:92-3451(-)
MASIRTQADDEGMYEVIHKMVVIRDMPSTTGQTKGALRSGIKVAGTPHLIDGSPWLSLSAQDLPNGNLKISTNGAWWVLIDASNVPSLGLGMLLRRLQDEVKKTSEETFDVVAKRVVVRTEPSLEAELLGALEECDQIKGWVETVDGRTWLRLASFRQHSNKKLKMKAYVLIDGESLGLPLFLEKATGPPKEKAKPKTKPKAKPKAEPVDFGDLSKWTHNLDGLAGLSFRVKLSTVNVRSLPHVKSKLVAILRADDVVEGERRGDWLLLTPDLEPAKLAAGLGKWVLIDGASIGRGLMMERYLPNPELKRVYGEAMEVKLPEKEKEKCILEVGTSSSSDTRCMRCGRGKIMVVHGLVSNTEVKLRFIQKEEDKVVAASSWSTATTPDVPEWEEGDEPVMDMMGVLRGSCAQCDCKGYVMDDNVTLNMDVSDARCTRCGCNVAAHEVHERSDDEDEEGKKKKKKKKQDDDEWGDLGRGEEFNRDKHVAARRKLHRNMAEMWERAGKLAEEIKRNQAADSGGEALRALRKFADRFANVEISKLKENDPKKAERLFRRFLEQGSEIICAAGAVDAVATVSCIAMQVNFPLLAKAPSDDLKAKTSALLEAIEAFSGVFERHVGPVEELLGDRRKAAKEAEAAAGPVKVRMVMPDLTIMVKRGEQELPGARAAEIEMPPGSTVADLRAAALQVFGKSAARLFCGGRYLGTEKMPLAAITEIEAGAAVQCLPSNKVLPPNVAALARPKGATPLPGTAAAEGDAAAQPQLNPHALPEGGLGYPIDASASTRRGGSAAKASSKDADVQEGAPRDKKAADAKSEETEAIGKANAVVAVEREEDIKAAGAQRRAAKAEEEERKAREEREAARLEEQKAKEAAEREAERERLEAEARAKAEVERKAAENEDAQDEAEDGEEGEDDWFDDFFDSAKKAADDKLAKEKKEAEMREAAERKRKQELEIAEAKRRVEEKAQKKEMQEKGLSAMQQRLLAQKQAAEAKKKLEEEKKKALEAKKKADEEKRRAEEVKLRVEMERKKAEEESRKKQEAVKCRDLVTSKEEPLQQLQQVRTGWDQDWDCPACAGGRRDDGTAIYCHPCQAWISLSAPFDHSTFDRHCQEKDFHYNWID